MSETRKIAAILWSRRFHQSIAGRSPLARRTPPRPHPNHRVAHRPL